MSDSAADTYDVLMEATYRTLAAEGYDGLTMRAVAERADKSRGLLHYHFDDKDDLVYSLLDHLLDGLTDSIRDPSGTPLEQLLTLLEWNAYGPDRTPSGDDDYFLAVFALRSRAPYDDEIRRRLTRNYETVVAACKTILEDGIEAGAFRPVDAEATAVFLVTSLDGARNTDLTLGGDDARQTAFEAIHQYVVPALTARYDPA